MNRRCVVVDEFEFDVKRVGEAHHHVQRQLLRGRFETCGDLACVRPGHPENLLPVQRVAPSKAVQERGELGRRASARRCDSSVKRRKQAHQASESRAPRGAREHPPEVPRLHARGMRQRRECHAACGHPRPKRRQQSHHRHALHSTPMLCAIGCAMVRHARALHGFTKCREIRADPCRTASAYS